MPTFETIILKLFFNSKNYQVIRELHYIASQVKLHKYCLLINFIIDSLSHYKYLESSKKFWKHIIFFNQVKLIV